MNGRVFDCEIGFAYDEACTADAPATGQCWAWAAHRPGAQTWWVKVKTDQGVVGWVDDSKGVLTGFDGC